MALRRILMLVLASLSLLVVRAETQAQDDPLGTARIEIVAGYETAYGNYCLPVANSGLGRQAAADGNLEWQLAANYSVVPVFVRLSHRQSIAMTGRVEVVSPNPYYAEEATGMHSMTMSRRYIAPPGVPITISMAPRVAPRAAPGSPVMLTVRIYKDGLQRPFATYQVQATQLEPAHVYTLLIDGTEQLRPPQASTIDVSQRVSMPKFLVQDKAAPYFGLLSMNHYLLPVARDTVTALPLAARDFAFVCVNAQAAKVWSESDQASLTQFVLGGGHLCVYNTQGLSRLGELELRSRQIGRGVVIAEAGGLSAAQARMDRWLTGELEEIALWMYGSVDGQRVFREQGEGRYNLRELSQLFLDLRAVYEGAEPTRRAGYLNPIWLYRETCRAAAAEPWDYPEFTVPFKITRPATLRVERNPVFQNWNLAWLQQQLRNVAVLPLRDQSQPPRSLQWGRAWGVSLALGVLLVALIALYAPRRSAVAASFGLATASLVCGAWAAVRPVAMPETRLVLVDADATTTNCVERMLSAEAGGTSATALNTLDLVRSVRSDSPGDIVVELSAISAARAEAEAISIIRSDASFVNLASEGACEVSASREWPVRLWSSHVNGEQVVHLSTSGLAASKSAVLVTPDGIEAVPGGVADYATVLAGNLPQLVPGTARLMDWQSRYRSTSQRFGSWQGAPDSFTLLRLAVSESPLFSNERTLATLGWIGLLQPIGGARSFVGNQCWVFCELGSSEHEARFLRLTLPLESHVD